MKENRKTIFIIIGIILFVSAIIVAFWLLNVSESDNHESNADTTNLFDLTSDFDTESLTLYSENNINLDSANIIYENDFIQINSFQKIDQEEFLQAGGCMINNRQYIININGESYEFNLENILNIVKPQSTQEYQDTLEFFYDFEPLFCGVEFLDQESKEFEYTNDDFIECNAKLDLIDERLDFEQNTFSFTFYLLNEGQPISLIKNTVSGSVVDDIFSDLTIEEVERIKICDDGYIY